MNTASPFSRLLRRLCAGALLGVSLAAGAHGAPGQAAESAAYARSELMVNIPKVILRDQQGKALRLDTLAESDRPVLLQFVFTSCASVCPVQAAVFSSAQARLDALGKPYRMLSISIDPEQDSPRQLLDFATKFKAGPHWRMLTGAPADVARVLKAFGAALPANNKMFHQPYTFLHAGPGQPWRKLDGMLSLAELEGEYLAAFGMPPPQRPVLAAAGRTD